MLEIAPGEESEERLNRTIERTLNFHDQARSGGDLRVDLDFQENARICRRHHRSGSGNQHGVGCAEPIGGTAVKIQVQIHIDGHVEVGWGRLKAELDAAD